MKLFGKMSKFVSSLLALTLVFGVGGGASAYSSELTQKQKEAYHKQYVEIVKEVNAKYPNANLEVVPLNKFSEEDWVEPEAFRKLAIARANATVTITESAPAEGPSLGAQAVSKTKSATIDANGTSVAIYITGSFETEYDPSADRQLFAGINSITSKSSKGTWTQTGYDPSLIDGGRTYEITVGGKLTLNGITSYHNVTVEFYCSATGGIS
jgi:cell division protein FtsB